LSRIIANIFARIGPTVIPLIIVKFGSIAPFKERVNHPNGKGFWKALRQKVVECCQ
jgi:hypothetical protein